MSALSIFLDQLVPLCKSSMKIVDISVLEAINKLSPTKVSLSYRNVEQTLREIDEAIVKNFAANFASEKKFLKSGILAMEMVLKKKSGDDESDAQKIMMLHASKAEVNANLVSNLFVRCSKMTIQREKDDQLDAWKSVAMNVLKNQHVNERINQCIEEYGILVEEPSIADTVEIVYVKNPSQKLRGFSGLNAVYINVEHFLLAKHVYEATIESIVLDQLLQIDIINIVVHEYAHLKLRKSINDFNTSSPILAKNKNLPNNYFEFGRYVEEQIFGAAVDWMESEIDVNYLESVISSVKNGTIIPKIQNLDEIIVREPPILMALDYSTSKTFF